MAEVLTYRGETLPDTRRAGVPATPAAAPTAAAPTASRRTAASRSWLDRLRGLTMRVLVTGGAGYVGSVTVEQLCWRRATR